jgi:hypothetical protein
MEFRASETGKSTPAPEKDRIKGSDKNADGSAKNASGRISVSPAVRSALKNKVRDHNASVRDSDKPSWSLTTIRQLLAVYRRGAGAFSTSHRPGIGRAAWAMARVNAYLYLLRSGRPKNPKYVTDNDLLPSEHPRASSRRSYEFEIEERSVSLRPPAGMAAAARRGLELHEEGRSGDGLKPETVSRAKRIAARETLTEAHVREMRAWFRRHKVDRRPGWSDRGKETPGYTAWMLWGGDSGWKWSEVKVSRLDREGGAEQRGRMGAPRSPKRNKKAKARPGRPAKVGPSSGCGTGSGGFKAGNNCAKEDGIPRKPFSMGGALKQGPKGELQAAKAAIAAKQAKVAAKQQKQQAKDQLTSKKAKALVRKKQKDAKEAEAKKQADAAAAAKKKAMLQKIRVKKANEKITVAATPKSIAEQIKEAKVAKANEGVKVVETPKTIAQEIAEAKAAAAAKTAATGKPAPYRMPAGAKEAVEPPQPTPPPSSLTIQKTLGGSTGAQLAVDPATGKQYVLKGGKSAAHIESESQADDLYRAAGVNVPQQQMHPSPEGPKKVAEFIKGKTLQELKDTNTKQYEAAVAKLKKDFVADALFANYDVIGMNLDNIVVGKGGKVFRIDNGGSLTFRAQGKPKDFGPEVKELDSLRNSSINASSASVFGSLTNKDISTQITAVLKRKDAILAAAKTPELKSAIEARMKFLAKWQKDFKQSLKPVKAAQSYAAANGDGLEKAVANVNGSPQAVAAVKSGKTSSAMSEDDRDSAVSAVWYHSLTANERKSLTSWGGSGWKEIIAKEHKGTVNNSPNAKAFYSGIAKLPAYEGDITRYLSSISSAQIKSWIGAKKWNTEWPSHPGKPTHASFSTIDRAAKSEESAKNGGSGYKGSVIIKIKSSLTAADTGKRLPINSEKEVIVKPSAVHSVEEHYWILHQNHSAVAGGKATQGTRMTTSQLQSTMGSGYDPTSESGATFVLVVREDAAVAAKPKPTKKKR